MFQNGGYVYMALSGWYTYLQSLAKYGILWVMFIRLFKTVVSFVKNLSLYVLQQFIYLFSNKLVTWLAFGKPGLRPSVLEY